ncbi:MAG: FeoC-like transcriptional regulator [Legionellaceae bacterium]|nr:FeoC-like transcriptional regulator [Legionellaceae bacterium]
MLFALRDYIAKEKRVSIEQLIRIFKTDVTALEPMLDIWVFRGVIAPDDNNKTCGVTCMGCVPQTVAYYFYLN